MAGDHDRQVVRDTLRQGLDLLNSHAGRGDEVEVATEDLVAKVGASVAEGQVIPRLGDVLDQAPGEERVVVVTDHDGGNVADGLEGLVRRLDLRAAQRVASRQWRGVERGKDDVSPGLLVEDLRREQTLVRRREEDVVHRLLEGEALRLRLLEARTAVVHREPEAVGLRGLGHDQRTDLSRQKLGVRLLKAEHIRIPFGDQVDELVARRILAEVVTDDFDGDTLRGGISLILGEHESMPQTGFEFVVTVYRK